MTDHSHLKLGKRARRHDPRTLQLARYLTAAGQAQAGQALPGQAQPIQPPASVDYTCGIRDWGMMLNDQLGCCTIAAVGHAVQTWTANASQELTVPDSTILEYYEKWDGYNPANPSTDQGGVELDVLNDWRQQGFGGVSLDAYAEIGLSGVRSPMSEVTQAIWVFGGAYIGVELPIRAQTQDVWDVPANLGPDDEPGSWGGHAIYLVGYDMRDSGPGTRDSGLGSSDSASRIPNSGTQTADSGSSVSVSGFRIPDSGASVSDSETQTSKIESRIAGSESRVASPQSPAPSAQPPTLTCITWGKPKKMTFAWFEKYCSEAYALVSKDWLKLSGVAPSGFDLATLESDLEEVSGVRCQE